MTIATRDVGQELQIGSGVMFFDPWDSSDVKTGEIDLGESESFSITIENESTDRKSRRTALRETIKEIVTEITRTGQAQTLSITFDNLGLFIAAETSTITQSAVGVTDEEIPNVATDRFYQLGASASNPVGVMGADTISFKSYPSTAAAWIASTAYALGAYVDPSNGYVYRSSGGTSDTPTEPTWPTTVGLTVVDNDITWTCIDPKTDFVEDTEYQLDSTADKGARIKWVSATDYNYIFAAYTPTANSRTRVSTGDVTAKTGGFRYISDNDGDDEIWYFPKVTLKPTGDFEMIGDGGEFRILGYEMSIQKSGSLAAIYRDGIPV